MGGKKVLNENKKVQMEVITPDENFPHCLFWIITLRLLSVSQYTSAVIVCGHTFHEIKQNDTLFVSENGIISISPLAIQKSWWAHKNHGNDY